MHGRYPLTSDCFAQISKKHARDEASPQIKRTKLWIDTDCMVGRVDGNLINGRADQDDGFAVLAMLHLPALFDVVGVSSVFGNGPGASTYASLNDLIAVHDAIDVKGEPPNETGSLPIPRRKVYLGADQFLQTRSNANPNPNSNPHPNPNPNPNPNPKP